MCFCRINQVKSSPVKKGFINFSTSWVIHESPCYCNFFENIILHAKAKYGKVTDKEWPCFYGR